MHIVNSWGEHDCFYVLSNQILATTNDICTTNVQNVLSHNNESLYMPESIFGMNLHLNKVNARGIHLGWLVVRATR